MGRRFSKAGSETGAPVNGFNTTGVDVGRMTTSVGVGEGGRVDVGRDNGVGAASAYSESEAFSDPG